MTDYLVSATNLKKYFGATHAVDDISLHVQEGEIYGLVGSDGAGKTTTMRLLVGALLPDAGEINVCGYDVRKQVEQVRSQIGYLSQRFSMYEDLTVLENIRFFAEVRGLSQTEWLPRSMEILEFVGLANFKDRRAGQLSGGMKQKLGLASALVTRPRLLLLDEPTTGVDPVTRQDFWQLVIKLVSQPLTPTPLSLAGEGSRERVGGVSVIISTPYMDEASRCHRVGFMKTGKNHCRGYTVQFAGAVEWARAGIARQSQSTCCVTWHTRMKMWRMSLRLATSCTSVSAKGNLTSSSGACPTRSNLLAAR